MLFAFEGPDEVGKTSLALGVAERLRSAGLPAEYVALPGHVVGTLGHHVYQLHHHPADFGVHALDPVSIQLLHVASHIDQLSRVIIPTLKNGGIAVLDRYWWSAPVYAEASGVAQPVIEALTNLQRAAWREAEASIIFLVRRAVPLTNVVPLPTFTRLREVYDRFAAAASSERVVVVENERDLDTALTFVEDVVRASVCVAEERPPLAEPSPTR